MHRAELFTVEITEENKNFMKIFYLEVTDMYGERSVCGNSAFPHRRQAEKLEQQQKEKHPGLENIGYSYTVEDLEIKFSERNGEHEPPVGKGFFWCYHWRTAAWLFDYHRGAGHWAYAMGNECTKFYGPLIPPPSPE